MVAHTGCEMGCFLLFAGVLFVLKLPHFVRFLSSFSARYRRRCYMRCYIFSIRSGLSSAPFRRINHPALHAPQNFRKRWFLETEKTAIYMAIKLDVNYGISRRVAEGILAEIGLDMSRFPCPGTHESASKQLYGKTRHQQLQVLAAHVAGGNRPCCGTSLLSAHPAGWGCRSRPTPPQRRRSR
jgi:hypothetical protein